MPSDEIGTKHYTRKDKESFEYVSAFEYLSASSSNLV